METPYDKDLESSQPTHNRPSVDSVSQQFYLSSCVNRSCGASRRLAFPLPAGCRKVCIAPNRFLVQEGIYDDFVAKMAERIRALRVGDGLDSRTNMGPLINHAARDKVGSTCQTRSTKLA